MDKPFSEFVEIAEKTISGEERTADYFNAVRKSVQNGGIDPEKLVAALAVEIKTDILRFLKAYHEWNFSHTR